MKLQRFFREQDVKFFHRWTRDALDAPKLLEALRDGNPDAAGAYSRVSVFRADCWSDELENAAAYHSADQKNKPLRIFAIVLDSADIQSAGITLTQTGEGTPGIKSVDARHCELSGNDEAFRSLLRSTARRFVEGESVIRVYSPDHIRIQLESFLCDPRTELVKGAEKRVQRAMGDVNIAEMGSRFNATKAQLEIKDGDNEPWIIDVTRPERPPTGVGVLLRLRSTLGAWLGRRRP